jgi:hypothetical protein
MVDFGQLTQVAVALVSIMQRLSSVARDQTSVDCLDIVYGVVIDRQNELKRLL